MGWVIVGVVAVWMLVAVALSVWIGLSLRNAEIEDEADRVRRSERDGRQTPADQDPDWESAA
ncbi:MULTISPECIES: hypothetical protein [unclassified Rhodococcus (in: high G+C Gram-positive bacteria)]|uniref:hypothetical protein n=1 Tax=unclassified Rhodococcus (in: high G+C Gram-positive bacteria) TaxID=192944 RepID=UPI000A8D4582|nr:MULTISPECIES: hypothetical protein [unclassified Rhodococcus (in: high G+C Gram-positive bacteria)]